MPLLLNGELSVRLQGWCKEAKITMVMGVFAAYEEMEAAIWFPRERFSEGTMRAFAECFLVFIEKMVAEPGLRVAEARWGQPISNS